MDINSSAVGDPTLVRTRVDIAYTASDGFRMESGFNNAPRGRDFVTPTANSVFLDALEELARLTALFGLEKEALERFNAVRERVAEFKAGRVAS